MILFISKPTSPPTIIITRPPFYSMAFVVIMNTRRAGAAGRRLSVGSDSQRDFQLASNISVLLHSQLSSVTLSFLSLCLRIPNPNTFLRAQQW
jgi:hypothetical protein